MTHEGHSGRGSVARAFSRSKRYRTDEEYRKKEAKEDREGYKKHKEARSEYHRNYSKILSEFRNRKCKDCGKILDYRTKGDYCDRHFQKHRKKKK